MKTNAFLGLRKNNKGQIAIESVLLMTVLLSCFFLVTKTIRDKQMISKMVEKPMNSVKAMTGYGTWNADGCTAPGKPRQTIGKCHPNSIARSLSSDPDPL